VGFNELATDCTSEIILTRSIAVAKKADRTGYDARYSCTVPNRRKWRVWNSHRHVTTLPIAIPDAEISEIRFSLCVVLWLNVL